MERFQNRPALLGYGAGRRPLTWIMVGIAVACLLFPACSSTSERDEVALSLYKQNSKSYYNSGKYRETIDQCQKGLAIEEDDISLNLTLSWALLKSGGKANLFAAHEQFLKTEDMLWFDTDFRIYLGLGQVCYKIAMTYDAKLDELTRRSKEDAELQELLEEEIEECAEGKEDFLEDAITYLQSTLEEERQKENIEAILTLGQAYAYMSDFYQAEIYLLEGLKLLESSTSFQQSKLDKDRTVTTDGRRFFERQITKNLNWEKELRGVLAFVYHRHKEYENALEQYDLLHERDLFDNFQYYNRGLTLQRLGRFDESINNFEKFLSTASVSGKQFDEDEHFHLAFKKIEECKAGKGKVESAQ